MGTLGPVVIALGGLCLASGAWAQESERASDRVPNPPPTPAADVAPNPVPAPAADVAPNAAPAPDMEFLEYLGSWQEEDDEWLLIAEWEGVNGKSEQERNEDDEGK